MKLSQKNSREQVHSPGKNPGVIIARILVSVLLTVALLFALVWSLMFAVAHGPSESMRDLIVGMCMQASATKFVPYLVLSKDEVKAIMENAEKAVDIVYKPTEMTSQFIKKVVTGENGETYEITVLVGPGGSAVITNQYGETEIVEQYNEWDYAIDGIQFITVSRSNFKAYLLIIKDPSRVYVGTSSDFKSGLPGSTFEEMAAKEGCIAMINGGEFSDPGGQGNGGAPQGLTYSKGSCVWDDGNSWKTFVGFDGSNKLIVGEGYTQASANSLGVRDGVCFRPMTTSSSGCLIYTDESGNIHVTSRSTTSPAQRTAIGQRADGAVIFLVTDGRSAASIGASYNDVTQLMYEYGAVTAGMLDGGSSAMLYYRDYFTIYNYDTSLLDQYQKKGLVNKYVAATPPRHIPTFFCVAPSGGNN